MKPILKLIKSVLKLTKQPLKLIKPVLKPIKFYGRFIGSEANKVVR